MNIAYVFDMQIEEDARTQKEISSLLKAGFGVRAFDWNKGENFPVRENPLTLAGRAVVRETAGIAVRKTEGIRRNLRPLLKYERTLLRWLIRNRKNFSAIHCVNLDTAFTCRVFAKWFLKECVYDVFDDYADAHACGGRLYRMIKRLDAWVMKGSKRVILCAEKRRAQLLRDPGNVTVICNAPEAGRTAPAGSTPGMEAEKPFTIVYVGNLTEHRMIPELLEAAAKHPEWRLEIGGDGPLKEQVRSCAEKHPQITFHGRMPYAEVLALEAAGDVLPALYDPALKNNTFAAPNKVFEAMRCGKPTIMVKNTGMDDLVERERLGRVIAPEAAALDNALAGIAAERPLWRQEAERIRRLFAENYCWERMEERLLEIYRQM